MTLLHHIPTNKVSEYWPVAEPFIAKAANRYKDNYDLEDVKRSVVDGDAALWLVTHDNAPVAALVTSEDVYPKRKVFLIELVGGKNASMWYYDTVEQLAEIAKCTGYDAIESTARAGWTKMAKDCGFKEVATVYEMEL